MTTSDEIPRDPCDWSDENMFRLALYRMANDERMLPTNVFFGVWFSGLFDEASRAIYDLADHCIDKAGMAIPGIVISMTDDALGWMRDTDAGQAAMRRICSLMEKPVYVENWERKIA